MEIESTLTRKKYIKLMVLFSLRSSNIYWILGLIFALFLTSFLTDSSPIFAIVLLAVVILCYTIWLLLTVLSKNHSFWFLKKHYTISDDGIIIKTSVFEQTIQWNAFYKWEKLAGYYILRFNNDRWFAIGKSDIPASEILSFEKLLGLKIYKISVITPTKIN